MCSLNNYYYLFNKNICLKNDTITIKTGEVYILKSGVAFLWEIDLEGNRFLLDILNKGNIIEVPKNDYVLYELIPREETEIWSLDWSTIKKSNLLMVEINKGLRKFFIRTFELGSIIRMKYIEDRVIYLLVFLSKKFGHRNKNNEIILTILLTHEEIACSVLSTRATITRVLKRLREQNRLRYTNIRNKRYITITYDTLLTCSCYI